MGKNKLKKFADMDTFRCALQYPREVLLNEGFPYRGTWNGGFFPLSGPRHTRTGLRKGEYTVALAKANPGRNYIGVDIKGARLWSGAKEVEEQGIANAAFLRTEIENIDRFFGPEEVDEIWITFPDPQMQKDPQAADVYALPSDVRTFPEEGGSGQSQDGFPVSFRIHQESGGIEWVRDTFHHRRPLWLRHGRPRQLHQDLL